MCLAIQCCGSWHTRFYSVCRPRYMTHLTSLASSCCCLLYRSIKALPMCVGEPSDTTMDTVQSIVWIEGSEICVRLLARKNRPNGSGVMRRTCSCSNDKNGSSRLLCPVHMLWRHFLANLPVGARPWQDISASNALVMLRDALASIGVQNASAFWTHDLRRGHADVCFWFALMYHSV